MQKAQLEYQKQQDAIANAQKWASINKSYSSDNSFPLNFTDNSSNESNIITDYYNGPMTNSQKQSIDKYGAFNTADKNGVKYQPKGVIYDGQDYGKLNVAKRGNKTMTVGEWTDNKNFKNSSGVNVANQKVWMTSNGQAWIWNGSKMTYEPIGGYQTRLVATK